MQPSKSEVFLPLFSAKVKELSAQGEYPIFTLYRVHLERNDGRLLQLDYRDYANAGSEIEALKGREVVVEGAIGEIQSSEAGFDISTADSMSCFLRPIDCQSNAVESTQTEDEISPVKQLGFEEIRNDMQRLGNVAFEAVRQSILVHSAIADDTGLPVTIDSIRQTGTSLFIESMKVRKWPLTTPERAFRTDKDYDQLITIGIKAMLSEAEKM